MKPMLLTIMVNIASFVGMTHTAASLEYYEFVPIPPSMYSNHVLKSADLYTNAFAPLSSQEDYKSISPGDAWKRIMSGENIVLLDVRTPEEFAIKRIPGSILIPVEPVDMVTTDVEVVIPEKNVPVFIYCRSGRRSVDAAKILAKLGYTEIYDLGGINSWPYDTIEASTELTLRWNVDPDGVIIG